MDYDEIREAARSQGCRVEELLALTRANDPFYAGLPGRARDAEWFADLWRMLGQPVGAHLRRLHYQLVSQASPPRMPTGRPYENTELCWQYLNTASRNARYLGLLSPTALEDHRSPEPHLYATSRTPPEPSWSVDYPPLDWEDAPSLPTITANLNMPRSLAELDLMVDGYDYSPADQPFHLELWIEKSTANDLLLPICWKYGVTLQTGVGYLSVRRVIQMLERVYEHGKPTRILYISDFDPSGEGMPIQVARQSEFWLETYAPGADLKLEPIVLTAAQVRHYGLPRTPIKDGNRQKDDFEDRHGSGAVELDALEALHPGELARLVEEAIEPYFDDDLRDRLDEAQDEAEDAVAAAWEGATTEERAVMREIEAEAAAILRLYREPVAALAARLDAELAPLNERLERVWQAMRDKRRALETELPDRPVSELEPPDSDEDWLFSADRDYEDQLDCYKERRPGKRSTSRGRMIACEVCGKPRQVKRKEARFCSKACRDKLVIAERKAQRVPLPEMPCAICGTPFQPVRQGARFCSKRCLRISGDRTRLEQRRAAS